MSTSYLSGQAVLNMLRETYGAQQANTGDPRMQQQAQLGAWDNTSGGRAALQQQNTCQWGVTGGHTGAGISGGTLVSQQLHQHRSAPKPIKNRWPFMKCKGCGVAGGVSEFEARDNTDAIYAFQCQGCRYEWSTNKIEDPDHLIACLRHEVDSFKLT